MTSLAQFTHIYFNGLSYILNVKKDDHRVSEIWLRGNFPLKRQVPSPSKSSSRFFISSFLRWLMISFSGLTTYCCLLIFEKTETIQAQLVNTNQSKTYQLAIGSVENKHDIHCQQSHDFSGRTDLPYKEKVSMRLDGGWGTCDEQL